MASEKKRKRVNGDEGGHHGSKKHKSAIENDSIKISVASTSREELMPILAVPVGLSMPHYAMTTYQQSTKNDVPLGRRQLLLHSSEHRRMDYIATEEFGNTAEKLLNHYVGIYDPKSGDLELVRVKKMAVRTSLRPSQEELDEQARKREYQTMLAQRQALGMEFGTKKSKKAIQSAAENAIIAAGKPNKATKALMSAIGENVVNMPTLEDLQAMAEADKPRPMADLTATKPQDVYPIRNLIDDDTLLHISISDWQEAARLKEPINTTSKYVSRRLRSALDHNEESKLKVLKYMLMTIEFYQRLKPGKGGSKTPSRNELDKLGHPGYILEGIRKRFAPEKLLSQWHLDKLTTHIMAMALFVDDYNVDTEDLKDDFRLQYKKTVELFRSLGCQTTAPTDRERGHMKLTATELKHRKIARLKIPLDFPKPRSNRRRARGRGVR